MQVRNEYRCRRCGNIFFEVQHEDLSPLESVMATIEDKTSLEVAHECGFGGIGIGDWIGASEVKTSGSIP